MAVVELALAGVAALWVLRRARGVAGGGGTLAGWTPSAAERSGWAPIGELPGVRVRDRARAYTTPAVRRVVAAMGLAARDLSGQLQVADVGQAERGAAFPPHVSHRWGRDLDLGYTLDEYPTPDDVAVDPRILRVLAAALPWVEVVGVNAVRRAAFDGAPFPVDEWKGHVGHLHLRLRAELTVQPRLAAGVAVRESDEDD